MKFHHKKATITIYFLLFLSWMSLFINATEKSNDTQDIIVEEDEMVKDEERVFYDYVKLMGLKAKAMVDDEEKEKDKLIGSEKIPIFQRHTIIFSLGDGMEDISLEAKDESMIRKKNIASLEESQENGFCSPEGWISTICFGNYGDEKPAKPFFSCNLSQEQSNSPWEIKNEGDFTTFNFNRFEQRAPPRKKEFTWATISREEREKDYAEYVDLTSEPKEDFQSQLKRLNQGPYNRETETFCKCVSRQFLSEPVRHLCGHPTWE